MNLNRLNETTSTLTAIGYILYFLVRHDWYAVVLYPITLGLFIVNVILLVYSLLLMKDETGSASALKIRPITVYLKLFVNVGFIILMLT